MSGHSSYPAQCSLSGQKFSSSRWKAGEGSACSGAGEDSVPVTDSDFTVLSGAAGVQTLSSGSSHKGNDAIGVGAAFLGR